MSTPHQTPTGRRWLVTPLLVGLFAACTDGTGPQRPVAPDASRLAAVRCEVTLASSTLRCGELSEGGARLDRRTFGEQGRYVRLTSSGVGYAAGVFSFNVTVQNVSTLAFGTQDGAARHADGVRVFFSEDPVATGGTGSITVANATGTGTFSAADQSYFQYGGQIGGVDQGDLGADGILSPAETSAAKQWRLNVPATVTTFSFLLYVSTETPAGALGTAAPQVASISPSPLVPGASATLTGENFSAIPGSNTVTIGGRAATVTAASATQLTVTVPCVSSGSVAVEVAAGGMKGVRYQHPLQVTQRTVGIGQAVVLTSSADSHCNELPATNAASRYLVAVFSANTSPAANSPFQFGADGAADGPLASRAPVADRVVAPARAATLQEQVEAGRQRQADEQHFRLLEANRREHARLRAHFGTRARADRRSGPVVNADPPLTRTFRIFDVNGGTCNQFYVVSATRVYFNGKIAIYEDDATPLAFKAGTSATMASNYLRIGDQFNADMEPIVRNNFGDILLRDTATDANGVLVALFTPRINTSFPGIAGFVVSCDQYPNDDASTPAVGGPYTGTGVNGASNHGEFFYAYQPVTDAAGYNSGNTPDNWYRTIRSTFIHESKHVASQAARTANAAPLEASWLEEGTARHAEELWMRNAVDNVAWKGNTGYGSAAQPLNVYCDVRPSGWAECDANTRRPASIMQRHFSSLYTTMFGSNARLLSPFGRTASDNNSYFYAISWSLVRYAIDRYGASDAAFLTALTQSSDVGPTNLANRAGVSIDQLLGGWALSLAADDHPLLAGPASPDIQMPTWNFRGIYQGLNTDIPASYTLAYPLIPAQFGFGSFTATSITTLRGGGALWYELSGTQSLPQLLRLEANGGGLPSSDLRVAVTRIQ